MVDARVLHINQPMLMFVYMDLSLNEKLFICVSLPGGVKDVVFSLQGVGLATTLAVIEYTCPQVVYDVDCLFANALKNNTMSSTHRKILAMKQELENHRKHINCAPKGSMELNLPVPHKIMPGAMTLVDSVVQDRDFRFDWEEEVESIFFLNRFNARIEHTDGWCRRLCVNFLENFKCKLHHFFLSFF